MILVDTSIWVRSLRREDAPERQELATLLLRDDVATTEIVIAEVLQGARSEEEYGHLVSRLDALHLYSAGVATWTAAARLSFDLRRQGMATPLSDLVIATVALENGLRLYTNDNDLQRVPGLKLHEAGAR